MKWMRALALAVCAAALLCAQQFKLDLDRLASKAADSVDISLNAFTLQLGAKFLDSSDPDQARIKKLVKGLEGIYIKIFTFKNAGAWSEADLDSVRKQLRAPEWSRIVGVKSSQDGETSEIYVRHDGPKIAGVAIIAAEPKELTVVNIVGQVDLDSIANLGGHFGIPKVEIKKK